MAEPRSSENRPINLRWEARVHPVLKRILASTIVLSTQSTGEPGEFHQLPADIETVVCGLKEPFFFWLWSFAAGKPSPARIAGLANIEEIALETADSRTLRGYKLRATLTGHQRHQPAGYLLVVQGNAMLSDQIITSFSGLADSGYDVFIFDYRGYGRSEGKRRLKAILHDYREIIEYLDSHSYANRAFYGLSLGGVILLDAIRKRSTGARVVIDSAPSRLSDYGCPEQHDPVNTLPKDATGFLVITGARDTVVPPAMSDELSKKARRQGARTLHHADFGHPFMDGFTKQRMAILREFLTGKATGID
jgi:alpha/beta superfamily hydrolase